MDTTYIPITRYWKPLTDQLYQAAGERLTELGHPAAPTSTAAGCAMAHNASETAP